MEIQHWQTKPILARDDGSYVISHKSFSGAINPYHVPANGEFAALHAKVHAFAQEHPEQVTPEPKPEPEPEPHSEPAPEPEVTE